MTNVLVYDDTDKTLDKLSERLDTTPAEIIEMLLDEYIADLKKMGYNI